MVTLPIHRQTRYDADEALQKIVTSNKYSNMSTDSLNSEESFYALLNFIPVSEHNNAIELLMPHLNASSRKVASRIYSQLNVSLADSSVAFLQICECVSSHTGVLNIPTTIGRQRNKVLSRYIVMYCMVQQYVNERQLSLQAVGRLFSKQFHHCTIIHSIKQLENLYATDVNIRQMMDDIAECLAEYGLFQIKQNLKSIRIL